MITKEILKQIAPHANATIISDLEKYLPDAFTRYQINTDLRMCHFIAQAAHETDEFKTLQEYASGAAYEGRKDLGNVNPGDGKRYKGRGIFQLTGRANYKIYGEKLKLPLVENPDLAMSPEVSVQTAAMYWNTKGLSAYADADDVTTITKKINGGLNGFESRKIYLERAKKLIKTQPVESFNIIMAKQGDKSSYVADLQTMLVNKGAKIVVDSSYGPATTAAVSAFQAKNNLEVTGMIDTDTLNKLMEA